MKHRDLFPRVFALRDLLPGRNISIGGWRWPSLLGRRNRLFDV